MMRFRPLLSSRAQATPMVVLSMILVMAASNLIVYNFVQSVQFRQIREKPLVQFTGTYIMNLSRAGYFVCPRLSAGARKNRYCGCETAEFHT